MPTQLSRRVFGKLIGAGAAYAVLQPELLPRKRALTSVAPHSEASTIVRLSSNENPYGPSPAALKAMTDAFSLAWRYPDEHEDYLVQQLAKLNGVGSDHILLGDGSGDLLRLAAMAFTNGSRKLVFADPTFEAIGAHARMAQADVVKIRLTSDYSHDLSAMLAASGDAGLIYICNPNNPTASITHKDTLSTFLAKISERTIVLIDEAYHHYVESPDYETTIPFVKRYANLVVARTFSKIYGMAGLRCGYCVAQPALIQKMRSYQSWDSLNIMALVAASAGLEDVEHVESGRRLNREVKHFLYT
ncbi:MAG: histidinol-phosphate transaminase, partial [Pyrinomonadaceae bacterium]